MDSKVLQKVLLVDSYQDFNDSFAANLKDRLACQLDIVNTLEQTRQRLKTSQYAVALCNLSLQDSVEGQVLKLLKQSGASVLAMTRSYSEEVHTHIESSQMADYVVQDSWGAVEHAVNLTYRLLTNSEKPLWILSLSHYSASKLQGLLKCQRFPIRVFEGGEKLNQALGLSKGTNELGGEDLPKMILITGASIQNSHALIELLDGLRRHYPSHSLPVMLCGRPDDLRVAMKLMKYGVNDFYNLHFSAEELYVRIEQYMPGIQQTLGSVDNSNTAN